MTYEGGMNEHAIPAAAARRFIRAAFESQDFEAGAADKVAALMVEADLHGSDGHGIIRLPQYIKRVRAGGMNKRPRIRVVREQAATALVDGDNGMGHLVVCFAAELAIRKARQSGVAWVNTRMSNHAGPASLYVRQVVAQGLICVYFAVGNANHLAPWGGTEQMLSTNPIAVGLPTRNEPPVVLDMATAMAAYGKVKAKAKRGEMMPPGWMIDRQGHPLLDPTRSAEGLLLPIGGHKGYGLALAVGFLAGTLGGAAMGRQVIDFNADHTSPTNTGQTVAVIDPAAFGDPEEFRRSTDTVVRDIRSSARLPGVDRIWLPGEQSFEKHARYAAAGFPLSQGVLDELNVLAEELGIAPLARTAAA
jgi:LDH2 family malate/lactate/ureidoglycolate dehydrogenase